MSGSELPRAVTFDVWYTLLYLTPASRRAYVRARREAWVSALESAGLSPSLARRRLHALEGEAQRREPRGIAFTLEEQRRWAAPGHPVNASRLTRALGRALGAVAVRPAPGALGLLDRLREKGFALGLVSNVVYESPATIREILDRTGVAGRVRTVVLSSEVGSAKPKARPLQIALDRLGVAPAAALHLGDSDYDILAAWRAGASAARYTGVRRSWPPSTGHGTGRVRTRVPEVDRWSRLPRALPDLWQRARRAAERGHQASA